MNLPHRLHPEEDPAKIVRPAYSDHLLCDNPVCPDLINHDLQQGKTAGNHQVCREDYRVQPTLHPGSVLVKGWEAGW